MADNLPPFLVDYLLDKYNQKTQDGPVPGLTGFAEFAKEFMGEHRPSLLQNVEGNYVIRLMNGDDVSVAPPFTPGEMQQSGRAIPVTGMETAREIRRAGGPMGGHGRG